MVPCTVMSMLSNTLSPSACETDITGLVGMYAMVLASGRPSALLDWNNNYADDPDKCVLFHCSNLPQDFFGKKGVMDYQEIIAGTVGKENTYGTWWAGSGPRTSPTAASPPTTSSGTIRAYLGEGEITEGPARHLRRLRRGEDPRAQKLCCATSARTASSTTWRSTPPASAAIVEEAIDEVPRVGRVQPRRGGGRRAGAAGTRVGEAAWSRRYPRRGLRHRLGAHRGHRRRQRARSEASEVALYPRWAKGQYCDPAKNRFRQHPLDYVEGHGGGRPRRPGPAGQEGRRAASSAIGIDTTGSTPCAVDRDGHAARPHEGLRGQSRTPCSCCGRTTPRCRRRSRSTRSRAPGAAPTSRSTRAGSTPRSGSGRRSSTSCATDPAVRKAAFSWVEHCDWMPALLTGTTDPADA